MYATPDVVGRFRRLASMGASERRRHPLIERNGKDELSFSRSSPADMQESPRAEAKTESAMDDDDDGWITFPVPVTRPRGRVNASPFPIFWMAKSSAAAATTGFVLWTLATIVDRCFPP
jgi:hypothetical protein